MTFFNKKEEVFHIELTPYGRYLMSIGKLMPHHYKFFDDDIVYDPYAISSDSSELQSEAHQRIINETPKLKPNANVTGVETSINILATSNVYLGPDLNDNRFNPLDDNVNYLQRQMGTSKNDSDYSIAFKVDLFRGKMVDSTTLPLSKFLTSSNTQNLNIPQINVKVSYDFKVDKSENIVNLTLSDETYTSNADDSGNIYVVEAENPIIRIRQLNSLDHFENFEISAFIVETAENFPIPGETANFYKPLKFLHRPKRVKNGLLVEEEQAAAGNPDYVHLEYTPDHVEYYFDLNTDKQIPQADLCATIGNLSVKNIYLDEKINCPDTDGGGGTDFDIYSSRVSFSDLEDCD